MRVAILADIHGNLPALDAVLNDAARKGIKTFWCLGDVVGYGPWPVHCWKTVQELKIDENAWVVGNHDLGLLNEQNRVLYTDRYARVVLDRHYEDCQMGYPSIFEQIKRIKTIAQPRPDVILAHGVPKPNDTFWTVTKYTKTKIDPEQAVADLSKEGIHPQIIAVGHTHKAIFWRKRVDQNPKDTKWLKEEPEGEMPLGDLSYQVVYLNPGSVGQPRGQGRKASYCYIDWNQMTVCFRRVRYRLKSTRTRMEELGYPRKLIQDWYSGSGNK